MKMYFNSNIKISLVLFIMFFFVKNISAQQWVEFSHQNHFKLFLNPASAGSNSEIFTSLAHRSQYTFLSKRAIASQFGEFSIPVFKKQYGVGLKLVNDFIGYYNLSSLCFAYKVLQ